MKIKKAHLAYFIIYYEGGFTFYFVCQWKKKVFDAISPDEKYKVNVYHTKIKSPLSFYKYIKDEGYYFFLYDVDGGLFKPSPFYGTSEVAAYDAIEFSYDTDKELLYPGKVGYDGYVLK